MKIHEYQAKAILARYGVTTPRGEVAFTKEEALQAAQRLKSNICVVKAQIHAGGRGKGGGVKLARSAEEAADIAGHILGMKLVTPQTGSAGPLSRLHGHRRFAARNQSLRFDRGRQVGGPRRQDDF